MGAIVDGTPLGSLFFDRDAQRLAQALLGKVLFHRVEGCWLAAEIIETEAYYRSEKASHASLGYSQKRKALFMAPGTIYMYYARGGDSLNFSCRGAGNAVLIKAGYPWLGAPRAGEMVARMAALNPLPGGARRPTEKLCAGQTLLCRALGLRVPEWDGRMIGGGQLRLLDVGLRPEAIIRTTRLGIPSGRDGHLLYRFIDRGRAPFCSKNPLTQRKAVAYRILPPPKN